MLSSSGIGQCQHSWHEHLPRRVHQLNSIIMTRVVGGSVHDVNGLASPDLGLSIATSYRPSDDNLKQPSILVSRDTLAMSNSVSYTPGYLYHSHLHFIEDFAMTGRHLG